MQSYRNFKVIDKNSKNQLAKLVIAHELGDFQFDVPKITPQRLIQLAREIVAEFPCEDVLTYYVPRCVKGNNCPMGKLYEAYQGVRRKISKAKKTFRIKDEKPF